MAGLTVALVTVMLMGESAVLRRGSVWVAGAAAVLSAWVLGVALEPFYARASRTAAASTGSAVAIGVLVAGVIAGAVPGLVGHTQEIGSFGSAEWLFDWLAKPLYWVMLFGAFPALILGAIFGLHARHRSVRWRADRHT